MKALSLLINVWALNFGINVIPKSTGRIDRRNGVDLLALTAGCDDGRLTFGTPGALAFHPKAAERYRQKVSEIHSALTKGDSASVEAIRLVRELIGKIIIHPAPGREPLQLEIAGDLEVLMSLEQGGNLTPPAVVAGARFVQARTSLEFRRVV